MIHIVTGKINSGKTTKITKIYDSLQKGDGFVSVKRMHYNKVHGYDLMHLKDKTTIPFIVHHEFCQDNKEIDCEIGPYLFYKETIDYIRSLVEQWIQNKVEPIYFDEIGMLELYGKGFYSVLKQCVELNIEVYITVREDLIQQVIKVFQMKEVEIL
jgi:nucleoside-triphosphatase THEP1